MFITTSNNREILVQEPAFVTWPGPHFLLLMPDHGLDRAELAKARERFVLFEFLTAPASPLSALRQVLLTASHISNLFTAPLLFSDTAPSRPDLEQQLRAVTDDPFLVADSRGTDNGLTQLLLGQNIVINPLFATFIRNLAPALENEFIDGALEALQEHLVWKETAT